MSDKTPNNSSKVIRAFSGVVVSNAMDKTIVVRVDRTKLNTRYQKRFTVSKKYKVHDEKNEAKIGDIVKFVECRPISKDKRWRLVGIDKKENK